jgi:hypothetical protein
MYFYPGGTWWDKQATRHRFWENFLCDLLHKKSLSGLPNLKSATLAQFAFVVLIAGCAILFSLAPEVIPTRRRFGRILGRFGVVSSVLLLSVPLFPSDKFPTAHSIAVVFGTLPALLAFAVLVGAILTEPVIPTFLRGISVLLLVLLVLCASIYTWEAFFHGPSLKLLAGLERVATLMALLWLMAIGRFVRLRLVQAVRLLSERAAAGKSSSPSGG